METPPSQLCIQGFEPELRPQPRITIFADERKRIPCRAGGEWTYIGVLMVPTARLDELTQLIAGLRAVHRYNGALKFSEVRPASREKRALAMSFAGEFARDGATGRNLLSFSVLGLNHDKLEARKFGGERLGTEVFSATYNRFFRSAVIGGAKYCFKRGAGRIIVDAIYHDSEGHLEEHEFFPTHIVAKLSQGADFEVRAGQVIFVRSDHREEAKAGTGLEWVSHILQMLDVLVGGLSHCLDYHVPNPGGRDDVARCLVELLCQLVQGGYVEDDPLGVRGRCTIGFFPDSHNLVYVARPILIDTLRLPFV